MRDERRRKCEGSLESAVKLGSQGRLVAIMTAMAMAVTMTISKAVALFLMLIPPGHPVTVSCHVK